MLVLMSHLLKVTFISTNPQENTSWVALCVGSELCVL